MNEFFVNNSLCLYTYLFIVFILFASIFFKRLKKYFLIAGVLLFSFDISYLMLLGFSLEKCSILTGVSLILVLISIKVGRKS